MSIYQPKRSSFWYVDILCPSGERIRHSTGTANKAEAQEYHDRLKSDLWRVVRLAERQIRSFDEAALRWLNESEHKKSLRNDQIKIGRLRPFFHKIPLHKISGDVCHEIVDKAVTGKATKATRNRYLALLRGILNRADKVWNWLDRAPYISLHKESKHRIRWITPQEARSLISHLPPHLVPIVQLALATGLRKANIYGLKWDQVDMQKGVAWIHPDEAKAGKAIGVPLNQTAVEALQSRQGKHHQFVFTYRGQPLKGEKNDGFYKACQAAGIKNFRFHDLRHTWASWLIQSGVGLAELQELGGWQSFEMVKRYAHLHPDHLRKHSQQIDRHLADFCHTPANRDDLQWKTA